MSVRLQGSRIVLFGECPIEEAERLADLLRDPSIDGIDWTGAQRIHTAVLQLVIRAKLPALGPCGDAFVARWIEPHMVAAPGARS